MGCVVTLSGTGAEQNAGGIITFEEKHEKGLEVWCATETDDLAAANAGIDALVAFEREMGLPTSLSELDGATNDETLRAVADTAVLTAARTKKLGRDEIFQVLYECR